MGRKRKTRPRGTVFANGRTWWVKYSINGRRVKPYSSGILIDAPNSKRDAEAFLDRERAKAELGIGMAFAGRATFEDLAELLRSHYKISRLRSLDRAEYCIARLAERFAGVRVEQITTEALDAYVSARHDAGVAFGTVRIELAALHKMFRLWADRAPLGEVRRVPAFPKVAAGEARKGFFERADFDRVLSHLPEHLRDVASFAYHSGWRKGEVLGLCWRQVDTAACVIRLDASQSKNGEARTLPYAQHPALVELIGRRQRARKDLCPWVFHRNGKPIRDLSTAWRSACEDAAVPGRLFHDLRRTAVRNLVRAGVPDTVAMKLTGHRTRSVFDRYDVSSDSDLADGMGRLAGHISDINRPEKGDLSRAE